MPSIAEFRLSITRALGDQLADELAKLAPAPLTAKELGELDRRGGVYQLYHNGNLVYVGKADKSLPDRLARHLKKIKGRANISLAEMSFTAIYVDEDLSAVAPETLLISRYRKISGVPWNFAGFGNNDPGRERDTSTVEPGHFDALYPVNLNIRCEGLAAGTRTVGQLLAQVKDTLPFLFRYEFGKNRPDKQPPEYHQTNITIPADNPAADEVFDLVARAMKGWQITVLPGYVIMYREHKTYASARRVYG